LSKIYLTQLLVLEIVQHILDWTIATLYCGALFLIVHTDTDLQPVTIQPAALVAVRIVVT